MSTKYLNSILKAKTRRNFIISIQTESGVAEEVDVVKGIIKNHFTARFQSHNIPRPILDKIEFNKSSIEESECLDELFSKE